MSAPKNPPAFPREDYQTDDAPGQRGMSLRDWFAGQVIGELTTWWPLDDEGYTVTDFAKIAAMRAERAYRTADAMLAARALEGAGR